MDTRMQAMKTRVEKIYIRIRELTSYTHDMEARKIVIVEVKLANIG